MAALTTYAQNKIINSILRNASLGQPATVYLALFSTLQTVGETATECTDANYARQALSWDAASLGQSANNGAESFPALATGFTLASVGIMDALTSGHCWIFDNLLEPVVYQAGDSPSLGDGGGTVSAT